jgi:hypothetical protein
VAAVLCTQTSACITLKSKGMQSSTSFTATGVQACADIECASTQADLTNSCIKGSKQYKCTQKRCAYMARKCSSQKRKIRRIRTVLADREETLQMVQGAVAG